MKAMSMTRPGCMERPRASSSRMPAASNKGHTGMVHSLGKWTSYSALRIAVQSMAMFSDPRIILAVHSKGTLLGTWNTPWSRNEIFFFKGAGIDDKTLNLLKDMKKCRLNRWGYALGAASIISQYSAHLTASSRNPAIASLHLDFEV